MKQTFAKEERLHSRILIGDLFNKGDAFFSYPFKVFTCEIEKTNQSPVQLLISVSKRNLKKAVDRNKVKRLIREGYRKNKSAILESRSNAEHQLLIGLIYTEKTILTYAEIERKIILILHRLKD